MHFWQTCQKILENRPKSFCSMSKNSGKRNSRKNFLSKRSFGLRRKSWFWQLRQKLIDSKPKKISLKVREQKKVGSSKKNFSLKFFFSTPTEKSVFTTLTETIRQHARNVSFNTRKRLRKRFFKEKTFPQIFLSDFVGEWIVDNPGGNFLLCSRYFVIHCLKLEERTFFIRKTFLQKFKWSSNIQFWQRRWKHFARSPKNFTTMCEKLNIFFKWLYFSSFLLWQTECSFYKPTESPCKQTKKI